MQARAKEGRKRRVVRMWTGRRIVVVVDVCMRTMSTCANFKTPLIMGHCLL